MSEIERRLESDINRLSSEYQAINKVAEEKVAEIKSEFNDLSSYYSASVKDGRLVSKALNWTSDIKSRFRNVIGSVENDRSHLGIPNHITPPTWTFDLVSGIQRPVVLGQTFMVRVEQALHVVYERPIAEFIVIVSDGFKEHQFVLGPEHCEARVDHMNPAAQLMIRPVSYKDAYEALSSQYL